MTQRAVVFDMYGTLLRIESVAAHAARAGAFDPDAFVAAWRATQLRYSLLCTVADAYRPFDEITALALEQTLAESGLALKQAQREALLQAWQSLPAYVDVAPALRALRQRGLATAVLTNGTRASATTLLERAGIHGLLDDVLSVEAVRVYKPHPRVYALATERFGCAPGAIVFVSSNGWDAWGGAHFGLDAVWCNRGGRPAEHLVPAARAALGGLDELEAFIAG